MGSSPPKKANKKVCGLTAQQCMEAHKVFALPRLSCRTCNLRKYLKQTRHSDSGIIQQLRTNAVLASVVKFPRNVAEVPPFDCPVLLVKVYAPCSRKKCPYWFESSRFLNCLVCYSLRVYKQNVSLTAFGRSLGFSSKEIKNKVAEVIQKLRLKFLENYIETNYEVLSRYRICFYCYATPDIHLIVYSDTTKRFFCLGGCQKLKKTPKMREIESKYKLPLGTVVRVAIDLFKDRELVRKTLQLTKKELDLALSNPRN